MKAKAILVLAVLAGAATGANAQGIGDYVKGAQKVVNTYSNKKSGGSVTENEVAAGLKEALQIGAKNATGKLSAVNGFFGNALVKVLMPPEAKKVENTLREIGLGNYVDQAILSMNRAAEDASSQALPIFVNAISKMSMQDAMNILRGGNDAATQYLKSKTTPALTSAFRPIIETSLEKVNATKYWSDVFTTYNKLPTTFKKINPDLAAYVTERALNGVFVYIADEEARIRQNPAARITDLLKKVFGQK